MRAKRGFAMTLLLAALLVRAAIPQGYMAESTAPGTLTITICHSDAVWQIPFEKREGQPGKSNHGEPQPCAFGALAGAATSPEDPALLPLPASVAEAFASNDAPFVLASAIRQLPPARAPPARA